MLPLWGSCDCVTVGSGLTTLIVWNPPPSEAAIDDLLRASWGSVACDRVSSNAFAMFASDDPADTRANGMSLVRFGSFYKIIIPTFLYSQLQRHRRADGVVGSLHLFCFCSLDAIVGPRHRDKRHRAANRIRFKRPTCVVAKPMWLILSTQAYRQAPVKQRTCKLLDIACFWRAFA